MGATMIEPPVIAHGRDADLALYADGRAMVASRAQGAMPGVVRFASIQDLLELAQKALRDGNARGWRITEL